MPKKQLISCARTRFGVSSSRAKTPRAVKRGQRAGLSGTVCAEFGATEPARGAKGKCARESNHHPENSPLLPLSPSLRLAHGAAGGIPAMEDNSSVPPTPPYMRDPSPVGAAANPSASVTNPATGAAPNPGVGLARGLFTAPRPNSAGAVAQAPGA